MFQRLCLAILLTTTSITAAPATAQTASGTGAADGAEELTVLIIERPPFAFADADGRPTGFSVELWQKVATGLSKEAPLKYRFQIESVFSDMLGKIERGEADLAAANISITADREQRMDFSLPIFDSGMRVLINSKHQGFDLWRAIWESGVVQLVVGAALILLIVAHLMWWLEGGGHTYFRKPYLEGIWDAFWWAFVIVTMGGFELQRPLRLAARVFAVFWILMGLFFISFFTAKITTALTVGQLTSDIRSYKDLADKRVGIARGTTFERFAQRHGVDFVPYPDLNEAIRAVESGEMDATLGDAAVLQYYTKTRGAGKVSVVGELFAPDKIGLALPQGSPWREQVNRQILELQENGEYHRLYQAYFGTD